MDIRNNWTLGEIKEVYDTPLLELIYKAGTLHRKYNDTAEYGHETDRCNRHKVL